MAFLYANTERSEREIRETIPFTIALRRIKYLGIDLPKETKNAYSENYDIDERNQTWHKHVLGLENQYCQNDYTTQGNLQIQCNTYQITKDILHRAKTEYFKIFMETQKSLNSQSNIENEKWKWMNRAPWVQTILQNYSYQNNMILAHIQKRNIDQ